MAVAVPPSAYDENGEFLNVPVVSMWVDEFHSRPACFDAVLENGQSLLSFEEDFDTVNPTSWKGLRLLDFMNLVPRFELHFRVSFFLSLSMSEYLSDVSWNPPARVARCKHTRELGATNKGFRGLGVDEQLLELSSANALSNAYFDLAFDLDTLSSSFPDLGRSGEADFPKQALGDVFPDAEELFRVNTEQELHVGEAPEVLSDTVSGSSEFNLGVASSTVTEPMDPLPPSLGSIVAGRIAGGLDTSSVSGAASEPEPDQRPVLNSRGAGSSRFCDGLPPQCLTSEGQIVPATDEDVPPGQSAYEILVRALVAWERIRRGCTDSTSVRWRQDYAVAGANVLQWIPIALDSAAVDANKRVQTMELLFRHLHHPWGAAEHVDPFNIAEKFADIDPVVLKDIVNIADGGVITGIPMPTATVHCPPSATALQHADVIMDHLWEYAARSYVHLFPPEGRDILDTCHIRFSQMHYVPDQDRPVVNPSHCGTDFPGNKPNSLSPVLDYEEVQSDYPDDVCEALWDILWHLLSSEHQHLLACFAAIKADIRKAFLQVAINWQSLGSLATEFQGFMALFRRIPFGWRFASHTFAPFPRAIKQRVLAKFKEILRDSDVFDGLSEDMKASLIANWEAVFAYCDDFVGVCLMMGALPSELACLLRTSGFAALGYECWNKKKSAEDGFYAYVQKFTGVVYDFSDFTAFIELDKWRKLIDLLEVALTELHGGATGFRLGFAQKVFGLLVWIVRVHSCLRSMSNGWRRCLKGVHTSSDPNSWCTPARSDEDPDDALTKLARDCLMLQEVAHMVLEDASVVKTPLFMLRSQPMFDGETEFPIGSVSMDASTTAICICCHVLREVVIIPIPYSLHLLMLDVLEKQVDDSYRMMTIAIMEMFAVPASQFQWGMRWRAMGLRGIHAFIDNTNAQHWIRSGYASTRIPQNLCLVSSALEFRGQYRMIDCRLPSDANCFPDDGSRAFTYVDGVGTWDLRKFNDTNQSYQNPYQLLPPVDDIGRMMTWLEDMRQPFQELSPFGLRAAASNVSGTERQPMAMSCRGAQCSPSRLPVRQFVEQFRNAFSFADCYEACRSDVLKWTSAHFGHGVCTDVYAAVRTGLKPLYGCEILPVAKHVFQHLTNRRCLGDAFDVDYSCTPNVDVAIFTFDCKDYCSAAKTIPGEFGETGWMFVHGIPDILRHMLVLPKAVVVETTGNALRVHNGSAPRQLIASLRDIGYVVYHNLVQVKYWDPTARERFILVALHNDLSAAESFDWPQPTFSSDYFPSIADVIVPDDEIPSDWWHYTDPGAHCACAYCATAARPPAVPTLVRDGRQQGVPHRVRTVVQYGPSMGLSPFPHQVRSLDGIAPTMLPSRGNAQIPDSTFVWDGVSIPSRTRRFVDKEMLRMAHMPDDTTDLAQRFGFSVCQVNAGIPVGTFTSILEQVSKVLEQSAVPLTAQHCSWQPGMYVTDLAVWDTTSSGVRGALPAAVPSAFLRAPPTSEQVHGIMQSLPSRDWSVPLHKSTATRNGVKRLRGPISHEEWVCMEYARHTCQALELESGTADRYRGAQREFYEFLTRYPGLSIEQRAAGIVMDQREARGIPAVWRPSEVEAVLIDYVLHAVGVRGLAWSTVGGKLSAIRHANVRAGVGDPRVGKLKLQQLLRGLKKYRGPKGKKKPVTRAMLKMLRSMVDLDDPDQATLWAAIITAFHLMARSAEYCAKLKGGQFDMDKVFKRASVQFLRNGRQLLGGFQWADSVRFTFAKTKAGGGEKRTVWAMDHELCPVRALVNMFRLNPTVDPQDPLFCWSPSSNKTSRGVTYADLMLVLKQSATALGSDPKEIGTHSLRRGGCSQYLMAGASYAQCKLYGRWRSDCVREYVDVWDDMFKDLGKKVVRGHRETGRVENEEMPERAVQLAEARRRWEKFQSEMLEGHRQRSGSFVVYS